MKDYIKYQHVEKLGSSDAAGILCGTVYVFPKLDGTNAQVWADDDGVIHCGSRNRELSLDKDNAGFMAAMLEDEAVCAMCRANPNKRFFGEWLVPHSLKTYQEEAWRKFYVFDILAQTPEGVYRYQHYDLVQALCETWEVEYIPPLLVIKSPTQENIYRCLDGNNFLIKDGAGNGEGVVLKNYSFVNNYGHQVWAKVVTSEFKAKNNKIFGPPQVSGSKKVEEEICLKHITQALVDKTLAKIKTEQDGWNSKMIPQLLGRVFHDLVKEHAWDMVKDHKFPKVCFKTLQKFCNNRVKALAMDVF